jgi:hypothetical protein
VNPWSNGIFSLKLEALEISSELLISAIILFVKMNSVHIQLANKGMWKIFLALSIVSGVS